MAELRVEYMPLGELLKRFAERNPKDRDVGEIGVSMSRFGYTAPVTLDEKTGRLVAGHGRLKTLEQRKRAGEAAPERIVSRADDWHVPVLRGVEFADEAEAEAYLVADNRLTEIGGWDRAVMVDMWDEWVDRGPEFWRGTGFDPDDADSWRADVEGFASATHEPKPRDGMRDVAFDLIYTVFNRDVTCCLAAQAGWRYGFQTKQRGRDNLVCPMHSELSGRHAVTFIDNDYFEYDHDWHVEHVAKYRPKYATVRDAMTREQCKDEGIQYYPLEQILEWADELAEHAENVIVIPKFGDPDRIPERFMLGYSIPTSHGGTPLPIEAFVGRSTHLLGGSWKQQLAYIEALGQDCRSLDNNHVRLIASKWAQWVDGAGDTHDLSQWMGVINNPLYVALAFSFGAIANTARDISPSTVVPAEEASTA